VVNEKEVEAPASVEQSGPPLLKRRVTLIALAMIGVLVILLLAHIRHNQAAQSQGRGPGGRGGQNGPIAVAVAKATVGDIQVRIPALGTITPLATVTVRTQISGQLQQIAFTEGQLVHRGDFLAQIDPRPYQAALEQNRGALRRDEALLADAQLNLKRFEDLIKEDSVAQQQLDTQRATVDQYLGTVESDKAQVNTALLNLQYAHIVSPVTGRVGLRQVDQGNYVTPGDANGIVVITELQPITAIFAVPEDNVSTLMQRIRSGATLMAEAYDKPDTTKLAEGKVLTVDNQIDTTTGTVKLRALFDNQDSSLFPNQFVNIELLVDVLQNQTVIPNAASHRGAPNGVPTTFVYLVNGDNTVSVRPVTLGVIDGERVAVLKGIAPGDVVVTEGADRLRDGASVVLPSSTPPSAASSATPAHSGAKDSHRNRQRPPPSQ